MKPPILAAFAFTLICAVQGNYIIEIEKPLPAQQVRGVVRDPAGATIPGVKVEEVSPDWKTVIRSTTSDKQGRFHLKSVASKGLYHLQFTYPAVNQVRLKLELDEKAKPGIDVILEPAT